MLHAEKFIFGIEIAKNRLNTGGGIREYRQVDVHAVVPRSLFTPINVSESRGPAVAPTMKRTNHNGTDILW